MARHWSAFCSHVSDKQAVALDRRAEELGLGSGLYLIIRASGSNLSTSKAQKLLSSDYATARRLLDAAFRWEPPTDAGSPADSEA